MHEAAVLPALLATRRLPHALCWCCGCGVGVLCVRAQHSVSGVAKTDAQHVRHMGGLVESAEAYARNMLETYLSKMKMVVNRVRDDSGRADVDKGAERRQDLAQFMKRQMKN